MANDKIIFVSLKEKDMAPYSGTLLTLALWPMICLRVCRSEARMSTIFKIMVHLDRMAET